MENEAIQIVGAGRFSTYSLILSRNNFYSDIPKQIGDLTEVELLDLRDNYLDGAIPLELCRINFMECLLLRGSMFEGRIRLEIERLSVLSLLQFDGYHRQFDGYL